MQLKLKVILASYNWYFAFLQLLLFLLHTKTIQRWINGGTRDDAGGANYERQFTGNVRTQTKSPKSELETPHRSVPVQTDTPAHNQRQKQTLGQQRRKRSLLRPDSDSKFLMRPTKIEIKQKQNRKLFSY